MYRSSISAHNQRILIKNGNILAVPIGWKARTDKEGNYIITLPEEWHIAYSIRYVSISKTEYCLKETFTINQLEYDNDNYIELHYIDNNFDDKAFCYTLGSCCTNDTFCAIL